MKKIETQTVINAPIDQVWDVLMNFKAYDQWNPFIRSITGNPAQGETLSVAIQIPGKSAMTMMPKVLVSNKNTEFRWKGKLGLPGIFDGEHYFVLSANGQNQTLFTHNEQFTGILSSLLLHFIAADTRMGFESMNEALKQHCEN